VDFALFYRSTLAPYLIPKHIWQGTGGGIHEDFGDPMLPPDEPGAMDPAAFKSLMEWDPRSPSEVVGCGPMKFVEWSPGAFAKSAKNEDFFYHQKPTIDGVLYRIYKTTDAATMALRGGDVDLVAWAIPPDYIPDLMNDPNIGISSAAEPGFFYLAFNMRMEDFGYNAAGVDVGKPFREAVAHCVDKKSIVTSLLQNFGVAADGPVSPANTLWFNDSLPTYAFDVDKAKTILENAGITDTDHDGWRELPTLGDDRFDILTPPADYDPIRSAAGLMIAQQMQAAGINAVSKPTAFAQICDCIDARSFDMYILGWSITGLDPDYLYDFFYSGNAEAGVNYPGYNNPEFDELILASRAEMNETKRVELIKECQGILVEDLPYDVLYYRQNIEAYRHPQNCI
jgi:ABC-type transport system substrate-binding protein